MTRCTWVPLDKPDYVQYHDKEWGIAVHDDRLHFEMLALEGAQAGLSWYTILKRRKGYREAFKHFDVNKVAEMSDEELEQILVNAAVIRNRLKVYSVRKNAQAFIAIQQEFGAFDNYIWAFVDGNSVVNRPASLKEVPASTPLSDKISKDLKKRGMGFVGSTIIYASLQAVGIVNDHMVCCRMNSLEADINKSASV